MKSRWVSNREMNDKNVVYIHNEIIFSQRKNEVTTFAGKWMQLETIILRKPS